MPHERGHASPGTDPGLARGFQVYGLRVPVVESDADDATRRGYLRIATEEAFAPPFVVDAWVKLLRSGTVDDPAFESLHGFYLLHESERIAQVRRRLQDVGEQRLADMDAAGIDQQVLAITAPGPQIFDAATGTAIATDANDWLAARIAEHPDRFHGLAAIAPQDPARAACEIERGVRKLGLKGVIVNSHTHGEYLDDSRFWPIFEAVEALDVPIYLHPTGPSKGMAEPLIAAGLDGAIYGFAVDTGMHALRILIAGVFDRFPRLRLVLGHCGEALPFWLSRLDYMHGVSVRAGRYPTVRRIQRRLSEYMRDNVYVTTSGMAWEPAIQFCRQVLGPDHVLYAMDYPYQYVPDEVRVGDELPVTLADKRAFFQENAERVFKL